MGRTGSRLTVAFPCTGTPCREARRPCNEIDCPRTNQTPRHSPEASHIALRVTKFHRPAMASEAVSHRPFSGRAPDQSPSNSLGAQLSITRLPQAAHRWQKMGLTAPTCPLLARPIPASFFVSASRGTGDKSVSRRGQSPVSRRPR